MTFLCCMNQSQLTCLHTIPFTVATQHGKTSLGRFAPRPRAGQWWCLPSQARSQSIWFEGQPLHHQSCKFQPKSWQPFGLPHLVESEEGCQPTASSVVFCLPWWLLVDAVHMAMAPICRHSGRGTPTLGPGKYCNKFQDVILNSDLFSMKYGVHPCHLMFFLRHVNC